MSKQHFFLKLIPPRPTFPFDMTEEEKRLMQEHVGYMGALFDAGNVLIYGPVMATDGAYGMGVFEAADEAEVHGIMEDDPTVKARLNKFEIAPMRVGAARGIR